MKYENLTWFIKNYDAKRATGEKFRRKIFLGFLNGKKYFSIGRGSKWWNEKPPKDEAWDYE